MSKQVNNSDIIAPNLFKNTIESAEQLDKTLNVLELTLQDILVTTAKIAKTTPLEGYENITKITGAIDDFSKAQKTLNTVSAERVEVNKIISKQTETAQKEAKTTKKNLTDEEKLVEVLNKTNDEQVKTRLKLQKAQKAQREELKDLLVLEDKETGQLEKVQAQLRILRREREKLQDVEGADVDRLNEINEAIDKNNEFIEANSDKLKKQKINVGNYAESVGAAISESEEFNGILGKLDEISNGLASKLVGLSKKTAQTGDEAEESGKKFKKFGKVLKASLIGVAIAIIGAVTKSFTASRRGAIELQIKMEQLSNSLTLIGSALIARFKGIGASIQNLYFNIQKLGVGASNLGTIIRGGSVPALDALNKKIQDNKAAIELGAKAFDNFGARLGKLNSQTADFLRNQAEVNDQIALLTKGIVTLAGQEERLQAAADDSTVSFDKQEAAQQEALKTAQARLRIEVELQNLRLDQAVLAVQRDLLSQGIEVEESQIRNLEVLKDRNAALALGEETVNTLSEAVVGLIEIENEQLIASIDANKTINEIRRDRYERELDFAIDAFDTIKSVEERRIGLGKLTEDEQIKSIAKITELTNRAFEQQIKLTEDYTGEKLKLNELVLIDDEKIIRERLRGAQLDDVVLGRVLEIIRERKILTQDLVDLETDLNDRVEERIKKELSAEQELAEFRQEVGVTLKEEEFQRQKDELEALDKFSVLKLAQAKASLEDLKNAEIAAEELSRDNQLTNTELIEDERQKIIEESEEEIRQIKNKSLEAQADLEKKALKKEEEARAESLSNTAEVLDAYFNKANEERLDAIDEEITANEKRTEQLTEAAAEGAESATENLAFQQQKQAELAKQREEEVRQQQLIELGLTAVKLYAAKVEAGDENALTSTITDVSLLTAFIEALPAFYKGTNGKTIGEVMGSPAISGRDGYIVRVDRDETILNPEKTKQYHALLDAGVIDKGGAQVVINDNPKMVERLESIEKAINSQPVYTGRDYRQTEHAIIDTIESRNRRDRKHYKTGGIW